MKGLSSIFGDLFGSRSIKKTPLYSIRSNLAVWARTGNYPSYMALPLAIEFPAEFWERIREIYRHTVSDMHERAVRVWWADGEFVLTESVRGKELQVVIPAQNVSVRYVPVPNSQYAERIVTVDNEIYAKRKVPIATLSHIKKIEVNFLFNMHTHPPFQGDATNPRMYSFFSGVDISEFLKTGTVINGLVTDCLWLMLKTNRTPRAVSIAADSVITTEFLQNQMGMKVYKAEFGRSAVAVAPVIGQLSGENTVSPPV